MKLKILWVFAAIFFLIASVHGQSANERILESYFEALVQQRELDDTIVAHLQQLSSTYAQQYQELIASPSHDDALLPWTYFLQKLEREKGGEILVELCKEGRNIDKVIRLFQRLQVVDQFSQAVVDTAQSTRRLLFFDIQEGDKVAEIGFGYGYILNLLGLVYENIDVYANELDAYHLKKTAQRIRDDFPVARRDNFHFLAGAPTSTNLEGKELDLIIMENVFHHIEDKTGFLKSLRASIQEKGAIVIIEEFRGVRPGSKVCSEVMYRPELIQLFEEADFKLQADQDLEGQYKTMLRFVKNERSELDK